MNQMTQVANPFGQQNSSQTASVAGSAAAVVEQERAIQEVQAAMVVAKKFPRDPVDAMDRILTACTRPTLAESAIYAYPRGGTTVEGPSIRLAEAVSQEWGNMQSGIRELSQSNGVSTVEAFAWDIQNNVRSTKTFQVKHQRKAQGEIKTLDDPRDIYELVANQGARRLRACLLAVIPGDVIEQAKNQCNVTLSNSIQVDEKSIAKLVEAFAKYGVTKEMLSHRLGGKHLELMIGAEMLQLRKIYRSLKDGMAKPHDFFVMEATSAAATSLEETLNASEKEAKAPPKKKATSKKTGKPTPAADSDAPTYAEIAESIKAAKTPDDVTSALDFTNELPGDQQAELQDMANTVLENLTQTD